jgi:hypothetical protein
MKEHIADAAHSTETAAVEEGAAAHTICNDSLGHCRRNSGQRVDLRGRRYIEIEFACDVARSVERAEWRSRKPFRSILGNFSTGVSGVSAARGTTLRIARTASGSTRLPIEGGMCGRVGGLLL